MKQTIEQRREYHQTKEDRQRKVLDRLRERIEAIRPYAARERVDANKLAVYEQEAANLERKLSLTT